MTKNENADPIFHGFDAFQHLSQTGMSVDAIIVTTIASAESVNFRIENSGDMQRVQNGGKCTGLEACMVVGISG